MSSPTAARASPGCAIPSSVRTARWALQPAVTPSPRRNAATHLPPTISSPSERVALLRDGRALGEVTAFYPIRGLAAALADANGGPPPLGGAWLTRARDAGLAVSAADRPRARDAGRFTGAAGRRSVHRRGTWWKGQDAHENKPQRGRRQASAHSAHSSPPLGDPRSAPC